MDALASTTALAAVAAASMWEGVALFTSIGDPVPSYTDESVPAKELLRHWRRYFPPAKSMQAALVVLGAGSAGTAAWGLRDSRPDAATAFGVTAAVNAAIFAYTMVSIMPLNNRLLPPGEVESKETEDGVRSLLQQWGRMHGVRTLLGAVALGASLYGAHTLLTSQ